MKSAQKRMRHWKKLEKERATMAPGLPYAIEAAVAFLLWQSVVFVGDGELTLLMSEFATAVKYKLPLKIVIVKNNSLGQVK